MISPETQGEFLKGGLDLGRVQGSRQYKMNFAGNTTKTPFIDRTDSGDFSMAGELGIINRIDVLLLPSFDPMSPSLMALKGQFLGDPRATAKAGNFSGSVYAAGGSGSKERADGDDDIDIFDGSVDKIEVQHDRQEVGMILGYRWAEKVLHYVNAIYYEEEVRGKVTNNAATLVDAKFKYNNSGSIYSTGLILYWRKMHFKLDYSYLTTNWTYLRREYMDSFNAGVGFVW